MLLRARLHRRQFSERVHLSDAAGLERRLAAVALSALQILNSVLPERPARDVALARRQMQKLPRADFTALLHRGTAHRRGVFKLLAEIRRRESSIAIARSRVGLRHFSRRADLRDVH